MPKDEDDSLEKKDQEDFQKNSDKEEKIDYTEEIQAGEKSSGNQNKRKIGITIAIIIGIIAILAGIG